MKFISKLLQMCFMESLSLFDPHLHKSIFKTDTHNLYIQNKFKTNKLQKHNVRKKRTYCQETWWECLSHFRIFQILRYEK